MKRAAKDEKSDHSELSKLETSILSKLDSLSLSQPEVLKEVDQPPLVYLLAGIIVGTICAVIMVAVINKSTAA